MKRLAFAQAQRYWVERAFQDAKQHRGVDDYQILGWHHHMVLLMVGMEFMLDQSLKHQALYPLLSYSDILSLLKYFPPKSVVTQEEIFRQMTIRHRKRKSIIDAARKLQRQLYGTGRVVPAG